jgi:hypothetical protein
LNWDKFGEQDIGKLQQGEFHLLNCFFGPIEDVYGTTNYYFTLTKPTKFDLPLIKFKKSEDSVEEGNVFALKTTYFSESMQSNQSKEDFLPQLVNLGSRLLQINTSQCEYGKIVLEYADGDICENNTRHRSRVIMVCDILADQKPIIQHIPEDPSSSSFIYFL